MLLEGKELGRTRAIFPPCFIMKQIQMSRPKVRRRTVSECEALLQKRGNAEREALYYKS